MIRRDDPVTRRRFTVAHELGHYLLHALPTLEAGASVFSESQPNSPRASDTNEVGETGELGELGDLGEVRVTGGEIDSVPDLRRWEIEANQFAAELLMPATLCLGLAEQFGPRCGNRRKVLAKRLGSELLVSETAMLYRLQFFGLGQL